MWQLRASFLFGLIACRIFIALVAAVFAFIYRTGIEGAHPDAQKAALPSSAPT